MLGDAELIQETCQRTQYPDICTSTLNSYRGSRLTDVKGLATIMINAGSANAADTSRFIRAELVKTVTDDPNAVKVLKRCSQDYKQAKTSLDGSVPFVSSGYLDLASIAVNAGRDYSDRCHDTFTFYNPPLSYPDALEQREVRFVELVAVAADIIKQLKEIN